MGVNRNSQCFFAHKPMLEPSTYPSSGQGFRLKTVCFKGNCWGAKNHGLFQVPDNQIWTQHEFSRLASIPRDVLVSETELDSHLIHEHVHMFVPGWFPFITLGPISICRAPFCHIAPSYRWPSLRREKSFARAQLHLLALVSTWNFWSCSRSALA